MTEQNKDTIIEPEFTVINEAGEPIHHHSFGGINSEEEELLSREIKTPITVRVLCILGLVLSLLFMLAVSVYLIFLFLLSALSLFRNEGLNASIFRFLKFFKNGLIIAVGTFLAIFSPVLGFSTIVVYFSLKGQDHDRDILTKTLKRFL